MNTPPLFLSPADLFRLTGRRRFKAQAKALDGLGIPYTRAATGEPLVRQTALDDVKPRARNRGPQWDRISL